MERPPHPPVPDADASGTPWPRLPRFASVALKLVIQNRKTINCCCFNAQNQPAKRNRQRARILDRRQFVHGKIAFRPDPHANALRQALLDRKSTRLNSTHLVISYAVFCLKKK